MITFKNPWGGGIEMGYYLDILALPRDPGPPWQPSEAAIY